MGAFINLVKVKRQKVLETPIKTSAKRSTPLAWHRYIAIIGYSGMKTTFSGCNSARPRSIVADLVPGRKGPIFGDFEKFQN